MIIVLDSVPNHMPATDTNMSPSDPTNTSDAVSFHGSEEPEVDDFLPATNAINLEALALVSLEVRKKHAIGGSSKVIDEALSCSVQTPPWQGSFNLVYAIIFSDGIKWVARIPGSAASTFGPLDARRMVSDIQTMSLIRSTTSIPMPEVFAWEVESNAVGVPYILEAFMEGNLLSERWDDGSWSTEDKRLKTLRSLAQVMSKLHKLRFDAIGALVCDQTTHVGEMVKVDRDLEKIMEGGSVWGTTSSIGPFATTRVWLLHNLDDSIKGHPTGEEAELQLLRLAIESIPSRLDAGGSFVLGHPDFNYQNIFVDDNGNVTGIIDWDGVQTRPRALGFACYPSWITRDWDPVMYGYGIPDCREEDSPEALLRYRRAYAAAFEEVQLPTSAYSPDDTALSQILEAIEIAVENRICRPWIILRLLEHAFDSRVPFTFPDFFKAFEAGTAGNWVIEVREAFGKMWHREA